METEILIPLLNRGGTFDPAGWFHLVSKGRHPITVERPDGTRVKLIQLVDDKATASQLAAFNRKKAADPSYRMLVDFEHFSHQKDKSTEAALWVDAMENRATGIWVQGEWSDLGESAVKNKRYRTISPVWFPHQTEMVEPGVFRPLEINDAGLTNKNNLSGLVPFWNRADFHGREATTQHSDNMNTQLIALLGLAATATDADILAKVQAFKNRAAEADALQVKLDSAKTEHDAFKNRYTTLLATSVDRALTEYAGVITAESKDAWKNRLTSDFENTFPLLQGLKPAGKAPVVHNAGKGAAAAAKKSPVHVEGQDPFLNRVGEVMVERKLDKADAIAATAAERPDLYDAYRTALTGGEQA